jgi:hypothetical protein
LDGVLGHVFYKHGAPNGAFPQPDSTENREEPRIRTQILCQSVLRVGFALLRCCAPFILGPSSTMRFDTDTQDLTAWGAQPSALPERLVLLGKPMGIPTPSLPG